MFPALRNLYSAIAPGKVSVYRCCSSEGELAMKSSLFVFVAGAITACMPASASAAVYTVTNPGSTKTTGTFVWALDKAADNPGSDTVRFSIGSGPVTVFLPAAQFLFGDLIIDGASQPGFAGVPLVSVKMAGTDRSSIFFLLGNNIQIRNLALIENIDQAHIHMRARNCIIDSCWIGTNPTGVVTSGGTGVRVGYSGSVLTGNQINKCLIGYQRTGIQVFGSVDTKIQGCAVGTNFAGTQLLPCTGSGIELFDAMGTYIGPAPGGNGNTIANCGADGVGLIESEDTVIINNRIFDIGELAIDHGMDDDVNSFEGGQIAPSNIKATRVNGSINITGDLFYISTDASTQFLVEIFAGSNRTPNNTGQGEHIVGIATVMTNASAQAAFSVSFPDTLPDEYEFYFSATATRFDQSFGTSTFSGASLPLIADVYEESNLGSNPAWIPSGVDSGPEYATDPTSPDDIDLASVPTELQIIVRESPGRNRIAGWTNSNLMTLPSDSSGLVFVRGKFYIHASNAASAPLNTVPNFRLRLQNEGSVIASTLYQYASTGRTAVPHESFYGITNKEELETRVGASMRPSANPALPSLYRIDFSPVVVDAARGSRIGATFESYSTEDTANGTLALSEVQLAAYRANGSPHPYVYTNDANFYAYAGFSDSGIESALNPAVFNVEADFQAGRRQALDLPGEVSESVLPQVFETADERGTILDTLNTPADKLGVGIFSARADSFTSAPRVEEGKIYFAIFIASSDMPAVASSPGEAVQGGINFLLQTGGGVVTSYLELAGPPSLAGPSGSVARRILEQALPGKNSENRLLVDYPFPAGEKGGAYIVLMSSPLDADIRRDTPGSLGPFADEPGPGVNLPSYRDIVYGVNAISHPSTLRVSPSLVVPWAPANRARVRLLAVLMGALPAIDDGGYLP